MSTKEGNCGPRTLTITGATTLNQTTANQIEKIIRPAGFIPGRPGWCNVHKSINVIQHIKEMEDEHHTNISIDARRAIDRTWHPFLITTLSNVRIWKTHFNRVKALCTKPRAVIGLDGENN